jgi:hypothetical protein
MRECCAHFLRTLRWQRERLKRSLRMTVCFDDELIDIRSAHRVHPLDQIDEITGAAAVARIGPVLQQIRAHADRLQAERDGIGEIVGVNAAGKRDGKTVAEYLAEAPHQQHGQHVQRRARQVHLLLACRKEAFVIADEQGIGKFDAEAAFQRLSQQAEPIDETGHLLPGSILLEGLFGNMQIAIAQSVVQDIGHQRLAKQRRVEFDDHMQTDLLQQKRGNRLDLLRRAPVESR